MAKSVPAWLRQVPQTRIGIVFSSGLAHKLWSKLEKMMTASLIMCLYGRKLKILKPSETLRTHIIDEYHKSRTVCKSWSWKELCLHKNSEIIRQATFVCKHTAKCMTNVNTPAPNGLWRNIHLSWWNSIIPLVPARHSLIYIFLPTYFNK